MRISQFRSAINPCAAECKGVEVQFSRWEEGEDGAGEQEGEEEGAEGVRLCGWIRWGTGRGGCGGGYGLGHGGVGG